MLFQIGELEAADAKRREVEEMMAQVRYLVITPYRLRGDDGAGLLTKCVAIPSVAIVIPCMDEGSRR